jgi:hypothetical protein
MDSMQDVIAAFVDGERVNADALNHALTPAEGREYLVDVLAMRELVVGEGLAGRALPSERVPSGPAKAWLFAAAAIALVVSAGTGFVAGQRTKESGRPITVQRARATAAPGDEPPVPTTVIRLQPGVDWNEQSGGH